MGSIGTFFDGLGRFIATWFGWAGNSFADSKALREELTKEREATDERLDLVPRDCAK